MKLWQLLLAGMVACDVLYNYLATHWSQNQQKWYLPVLTFMVMGVMNLCFLGALADGSGLARASVWFGALSGIFGVLLGVLWFQEAVNTQQALGLVLGLVALWLLR